MQLGTYTKPIVESPRTWNQYLLILTIVFVIALCSCRIIAQSGAGSIQGTVTDSSGGVIPNAVIHVVNPATGVATDSKSNGVGFYQVPELFTGTYTITVTVPNMKTYETTLQLLVAQAAVINPVMTAGLVSQQVVVSGTDVQLTTTDSGAIADTLDSTRINELAENGRSLQTLLTMTTPGYETPVGGDIAGGAMLNGLMPEAFSYVAEGAPLNNRQFGGQNTAQAQDPDPDAIAQVRAVTVDGSAEYAEPGTAVITTKSGTNQLHGALFETAVNNAWGVAKSRQDPSNFSAPHYVRNEFGASAGGPIILPHVYHGQDKSFWFVAYERYSLASGLTGQFSVPTAGSAGGDGTNMDNGDWSDLLKLPVPEQLYNPATTYNSGSAACPATGTPNQFCRTAFANNQIPATSESPTMKIMDDLTPKPAGSLAGNNPLIEPNLSAPIPSINIIPTWTFRVDHVFNENNRVYIRYQSNTENSESLREGNELPTLAADGFPAGASGLATFPSSTFAGSLGFTHIFSPSFFSETIVSNQWFSQHNYAGGSPLTDFEQKLGLPNNFGEPGFPNWGEYTNPLLTEQDGTEYLYGMSSIVSTLDENLTKTIGNHQMQFGGRYRRERFGYLPTEFEDFVEFGDNTPAPTSPGGLATGIEDPSTSAAGLYNALPNTGNQNGDAFLGAANDYSVDLEPPYEHFHDMEFDAYFQDNYRMTRNLTWNLGLRYEAHPATWLKGGVMQSFDLKNDAFAMASTPAQLIAEGKTTQAIITNMENIGVKFETFADAGIPSAGVDNYNLNFLPRVGVAWQPFGGKYGTVIRGGYGRYIYPIPVRTTYSPITANAPFAATYTQNYQLPGQSPDGLANYLVRNPVSVVAGVNSSNVVNSSTTTALLPGDVGPYTLPVDEAPDFVTETNFTLEQALKGNSALRVSWVWTHGTNLDQIYSYNNPPSTFTWEMETGTYPPDSTVIGSNQYYSTATNPYDQTTYNGNGLDQKTGWSNDNSLQVNYQRLYHHGIAWQISYDYSKAMRVGGNYFRGPTAGIIPSQNFADSGLGSYTLYPGENPVTTIALPPARPTGIASYAYYHSLDVYEDYVVDTAVPVQEVQFNAFGNLPFGRGQRYLGRANRALNELVGGWQLGGDGQIHSQNEQVASGNYGPHNPIHTYKHAHPVTDCTSGTCIKSFQWFNGYIPPSSLSSSGCSTVVNGLPSSYLPYEEPLDTNYNPTTTCGTAQDPWYNTNQVQTNVPGSGAGDTDSQGFVPDAYSNEADPAYKTFINGPMNYTVDLSIFKVFPITESTRLRFNMDAFNAFNVQGYNEPSTSTGLENMLSSYNSPRQVQFTLRFEF